MEVNVMSWNMAGAKLLYYLDPPQSKVASSYITAYNTVWKNEIIPYGGTPTNSYQYPDIILLQECIGFVDQSETPSGRWQSGEEILQSIYEGYRCFFFPAFSSYTNPHPRRWQKYREGRKISNYLPDYVEAQQGYGICIRDEKRLRTLWVDKMDPRKVSPDSDISKTGSRLFESIPLTTGLYLGGRNTEPRLVIMGRLKIGSPGIDERYLNVLNVHLTTLIGERAGNLRLNRMASEYRLRQLDLILNDIISAYQEAETYRIPRKIKDGRKEDIWIVGGDFNATPDSEELTLMKRMGFIDGNPDKLIMDTNQNSPLHNHIGTKWSKSDKTMPPIVLDYILCGLEGTTFPAEALITKHSHRPYRPSFDDKSFETDHAVLLATFEF